MRAELRALGATLAWMISGAAAVGQPPPMASQAGAAVQTPLDLFGPLYSAVELQGLFADSKTFADAVPLQSPSEIMRAYRAESPRSREALRRFVDLHFRLPVSASAPEAKVVAPGELTPIDRHIANLWPILTREDPRVPPGSSLISIPRPFVVPGGRFRELYYWDSYFTMLGLKADGRDDMVESMIDDFGSLIERFGHIPNGTRTYYISRSQPPFFFAMVALSHSTDEAVQARRLRWLMAEHAFWMAGEAGLASGQAAAHVVRLPDGGVLNRPFDARDTPREESFREDVSLAERTGRPEGQLDRDLRAGAETGWDYSSRWLADGRSLATVHTTDIVPADLNSLLWGLETAIAGRCRQTGEGACAARYDAMAERRAAEMRRYLWDGRTGAFRDYDWRAGRQTAVLSAAMVYPLFVGLASTAEARATADVVRRVMLAPGGLRTTLTRTGQQWDAPNGWAPLQWLAVSGLRRYGEETLAREVACRWMATVGRSYAATGRLLEKYDVEEQAPGRGGEYPLQDGFGWTNGVALSLSGVRCPRQPHFGSP
jgi:alpha,alpha-trehalase